MKKTSRQELLNSRTWIDKANAVDVETYIAAQENDELNARVVPTLRDWHEKGYAILRNAVLPADVDRMQDEVNFIRSHRTSFDIFIDGKKKHFQKRKLAALNEEDLQDTGLKLSELHTISPRAAELAMNPVVLRFLRHVFAAPPALLQSLTFNKSSEQDIHQDFAYVFSQREVAKLAACWIALEDISPDSGPLEYYVGSHQIGNYDCYDWGGGSVNSMPDGVPHGPQYLAYLKKKIAEHAWKKEIFLPRKGDVLMWHGALIHGGTPMKNPSLTRKSFICHYTALESHLSIPDKVNGGYIFNKAPAKIEDAMAAKGLKSRLKSLLGGATQK